MEIIITAFIAALGPIILILLQSRNRKAETDEAVSIAYGNLAKDLRLEIERLFNRINIIEEKRKGELLELDELKNFIVNLETIIDTYVKMDGDLRKGVVILREQIIDDLGEVPKYELPPEINFKIIGK